MKLLALCQPRTLRVDLVSTLFAGEVVFPLEHSLTQTFYLLVLRQRVNSHITLMICFIELHVLAKILLTRFTNRRPCIQLISS